MIALKDRYRGCLLGGAVGDALGAPLEFLDHAAIKASGLVDQSDPFRPAGVRRYGQAYGRHGAITDDTQMTLFTAEGLIRARHRQLRNGLGEVPGAVFRAYLRWYATQTNPGPPARPDGWLAGLRPLYSRRGPGTTCLGALRSGLMGTPERPINNSKGCGGVMRAAPAGLARGWDAWDLGCRTAAITHTHPSGYLSAGAFAVMIAELVAGKTLTQAVDQALVRLKAEPHGGEVRSLLERAMYAAETGIADHEHVVALGEGWVAEEALAIGVYCAAAVDEFLDGVALAVTHGGDSDSTGSIAGQLLGALHGVHAIPPELLVDLELREEILGLADDLYDGFAGAGAVPDDALWAKYPG